VNLAPYLLGVQVQIATYLSSRPADPNALYILWAGHNDIFIPLGTVPYPALLDALDAAKAAFLVNTKNNIQTLWAAGAGHILVVGFGDIGKPPPENGYGPWLTSLAASFDEGLANVLNELAATGVPTIAVDGLAGAAAIAANPAQYGFVDVTHDPYPGAPIPDYAYFGGHPSTQYHRLIAQWMERSLIDYFSPSRGKGQPPAQVNALNGLVRAGKP
jgi:phospholipase/lecithinase/hemolysin